MIHQYQNNGYNIVLDVNSGAVHVVDQEAYDVIKVLNRMNEDHTVETLKAPETAEALKKELGEKYSETDLIDILEAVTELTEQGRLFTRDIYESFIDVVKQRKTVVKALCLHIAHDCNLACKYCFAEEGEYHGRRALMSYEVGKKALDFLIANSGTRRNLEVDFFGGEPLMNWQVVKDLVAYGREQEKLHDKHFRFTLTTNGVLLNDEVQEFVNKEMDNVVISLDGRKEVNDQMRPFRNGKGSYDLIVPKFQKLAESRNQEKYYIRGTFTRNNLDFSKDVLALADQGFEQISVEPVVLAPSSPYALLQEQLPGILEQYDILYKEYVKRRADGRWFSFFHFCVDLAGGPCIKKRLKGCGAGVEYVAVTADGEIFPCHQFVGRKGYCMGSVLDDTLDESIREKFAHAHVLNKEKCANCWARLYCTGGCAANADAFHDGDLTKPYDMECEMEKKRLECAIAVTAGEMEARGEAE